MHEDTDKGWVWARLGKDFQSRTTIRISRKSAGRSWSVYCEYREIDTNLVKMYDAAENTKPMYFSSKSTAKTAKRKDINLSGLGDVAVISDWYRHALGGFDTFARSETLQTLCFDQPYWAWWRDLRAACQHPEPGVRVATRVSILGAWLGVTGLLFAVGDPLRSWLAAHCLPSPSLLMPSLSLLFALICGFAWKGIHRAPDDGPGL
ncbi:MAG: hypothetical protein WA609_16010 [Terriglobales bacterium]